MSSFNRNTHVSYSVVNAQTGTRIDEGLRSYMLGVYNYMTFGLALTGLFALGTVFLTTTGDPNAAVAQLQDGTLLTSFGLALYASPLKWLVMLAPFGLVMFLSLRIQSMNSSVARSTFLAYAAMMGVSLSSIFLVYTHTSVARIFFITAISFGSLSLFGYTTRRNLSAFGSFLMMGLIGIIVSSLANAFLASSALQLMTSTIGVLVFAGLTAWDTQQIKEMYYSEDGNEMTAKKSIMGALRLYLDFINLFLMLLQLLGNRD